MSSRFRFIQTSDVHLDRRFSGFQDFEPILQKAQRDTFDLIISLSRRDKVDALLVAGNLFDSPEPAPELVTWVKEKCSSIAPTKVLISPGSSDPCTANSVYMKSAWPENVHIFREEKMSPFVLKELGVVVYGFGYRSSSPRSNPVVSFRPSRDPNLMMLLMFHGSVSDVNYPDPYPVAPFRFQDLVEIGCDYAALGHFHRIQSLKRKGEKGIRGCYSGVPQGLDFEDEGEKGILEIEMDSGKKEINFLPTARIKFQNITLNCQGVKSDQEVINRIFTLAGERNLAGMPSKIILTGGVDTEKPLDMDRIYGALDAGCMYLRLDNKTVSGYDVVSFSKEHSTRGMFAAAMLERIGQLESQPPDPDYPEMLQEQKEVLDLALKYGLDAFTAEEVKHRW